MKILTTSILLITTLLVVPVVTYFFGTTPGAAEWPVLRLLLLILLGSVAYTFIVGEITNNNSQVDKLWSLLPVAYAWVMAAAGDYSQRMVMMALLVSLWGIRLTTNFAMKGAYQWKFWGGEEDYRWKVLRAKPEFRGRIRWMLFDLLFICGYQNILILLFTLPMLVALQYNSVPVGMYDYLVAAFMLLFIVFEMIADIQQWNFQSRKYARIAKGEQAGEEEQKGFLDRGLWAYSRHPNYFAEQSIWICFYFFGVVASGEWFNWSIAGCLLLVVLFQGSSAFSEEISAGKYPHYKTYMQKVSRFIPLPNRYQKDQ
jgi:steroid 5-alpha reductase family enzyme